MDQLTAQLLSLATVVLGALGILVRHIANKIVAENKVLQKKLEENTEITRKVEGQTNGELAKTRNLAQRLQLERDAYRDMVRFVNATPDGRKLLLEYADRRKVRVADAELEALLVASDPKPQP
jgi:sensor domain CHASE-containing protein